jgi:hypothetical protein
MDVLGSITGFVNKLTGPTAFAIAIASGIVLFGGENVQVQLGVADFLKMHRAWVGGTFLVSTAIFATRAGMILWSSIRKAAKRRSNRADGYDRLKNLTRLERELLRQFFIENTRTCRLPMAQCYGLEAAGILYKPAQMVLRHFSEDDYHPSFVIADWAWNHLSDHPELLNT